MKSTFKTLALFLLSTTSSALLAQNATSASQVQESLNQKETLTNNSIVKNIAFNNIGPTVMSGRVADLAVNPNDPTEFYVGYAFWWFVAHYEQWNYFYASYGQFSNPEYRGYCCGLDNKNNLGRNW